AASRQASKGILILTTAREARGMAHIPLRHFRWIGSANPTAGYATHESFSLGGPWRDGPWSGALSKLRREIGCYFHSNADFANFRSRPCHGRVPLSYVPIVAQLIVRLSCATRTAKLGQ